MKSSAPSGVPPGDTSAGRSLFSSDIPTATRDASGDARRCNDNRPNDGERPETNNRCASAAAWSDRRTIRCGNHYVSVEVFKEISLRILAATPAPAFRARPSQCSNSATASSSAAAASRTSLVSVRNPAISEESPAFRPRPPRPPMISVSVSSLAGDCCGASQTADKFSSYYDSRNRSRTRRSARYGPANGRRSLFGLPNRALRAVFYENSRKKRKLVSGPRRGILCASCRPRYNGTAAGVRGPSTPEARKGVPRPAK